MEYPQDTKVRLYATFVDYLGEEATISGTPTISIFRKKGNSNETVLDAVNMTNLNSSTYYYDYYINTNSPLVDHYVKYSATYDDSSVVVGDELFVVIPRGTYTKIGAGMTKKIMRTVWTEDDKKKLFDDVKTIEKKVDEPQTIVKVVKPDIKDIEATMKDTNTMLSEISKDISSIDKTQVQIPIQEKYNDTELKGMISSLVEENKGLKEDNKLIIELCSIILPDDKLDKLVKKYGK